MFKYMYDICLGVEKVNGWVIYDEQYCLRIDFNFLNNWGIIDSEF